MKLKALLLCGLAVASFGTAQAAEITVSGTTTGSFQPGGLPTLGGLTFAGTPFSATTVDNFAAFGNLGTLSLTNVPPFPYTGGSFTLNVNFLVPTGIAGSNSTTYTAALTGTVDILGAGGVFFNFNNDGQVFTFNDGVNAGSFTVFVNDVSVNLNGAEAASNQITGVLIGSQDRITQGVPDGGTTAALLGLSLLGVAVVSRKLGGVSMLKA